MIFRNSAKFLIALLIAGVSNAASAITLQIDEIVMTGPTYQNDQWTLTVNQPLITGPITSTVVYTVTLADVFGANLLNAATNWTAAINNDATMSDFLTASLETDITDTTFQIIHLTAKSEGLRFFSFVSVFEASEFDFNEETPLTVSVSTIVAAVPLPAALPLFATALAGMGLLGWRRRRRFTKQLH